MQHIPLLWRSFLIISNLRQTRLQQLYLSDRTVCELSAGICSRTNAEVLLNLSSYAGLPVRSIQWGAWGGVGMVASSAAVLVRMERGGISAIAPAMGLRALQGILLSTVSTVSPCCGLCHTAFELMPRCCCQYLIWIGTGKAH